MLFTTEESALDNLLREGISKDKVHFVGNVMIDTLSYNLDHAVPSGSTLGDIGMTCGDSGYGLLTLHRPSNVDDPEVHTYSDPDWLLYRGPTFINAGFGCTPNSEVLNVSLAVGEYALDLRDFRHADEDTIAGYPGRVCYDISVTP